MRWRPAKPPSSSKQTIFHSIRTNGHAVEPGDAMGQLTVIPAGALPERTVDGVRVASAYAEIRSLLVTRLSGEHAALFAEPKAQANGTGWHSRLEGDAVPVAGLPLRERVTAMQRVERL